MLRVIALLLAIMLQQLALAIVPTSDSPLAGTGDTDGPNVMLALSIEFPTAGWAYQTSFDTTQEYIGYFNSNTCYNYNSSGNGYFQPAGNVTNSSNRTCSGNWSGNFLNWATGTAVDVFRKTLTGGYRSVDTTTSTRLRLSRPGYSASKTTPTGLSLASHSQYSDPSGTIRNLAYTFSRTNTGAPGGYQVTISRTWQSRNNGNNWSNQSQTLGTFYLEVEVCKSSSSYSIDENCKLYTPSVSTTVYKPEGLIQKYSKTMRVGVSSYLLDNSYSRDGGVLRARLKYPGCYQQVTTNAGNVVTLDKEWDPSSGIIASNPDSNDAVASSVSNSGVVNYLNRFGENGYKTYDPAAELYYATLRYLRNKGHYNPFTAGMTTAMKDSFPVITDWDDPYKNSSQKSFIIYLGDVNVHGDVDLPGATAGTWGPSGNQTGLRQPTDDSNVNVTSLLQTIRGSNTSNIGSTNSPGYIAALAYWGNATDIRPDKPGNQNVKAFMIDVVESGSYKTETTNSFYLAAKWGGFNDGNGNNLPDVRSEWTTDQQTISAFPSGVPDNYAPANNPQALVAALNRAFSYAALAVQPSLAGLTASQSSPDAAIQTGDHIFRTTYVRSESDASDWFGDIEVYKITLANNTITNTSLSLDWNTKSTLEQQLGTTATGRNIYAYNRSSRTGIAFSSNSSYLQTQIGGDSNLLEFLRGNNSNAGNNGSKLYRTRQYRLGPIEQSSVAFMGNAVDVPGCTPGFSSAAKNRVSIYAAAANDGFLHIFNYGNLNSSDKGKELFAFMPSAVYAKAAKLSDKNYSYERLNDGNPSISNICLSNTPTTVLVGSTGKGVVNSDGTASSSIYAIDVTAPSSMTASNILWEFSSSDDPYLGNNLSTPKIVKLNNGRWAAIIGSGINQQSGNGSLFILMLDKPVGAAWLLNSNYFRIDVSNIGNSLLFSPNGIGDITPYDSDGNGTVDYVYAGDVNGNVWKFNLTGSSGWSIAFSGQPIFTAYQVNNASLGSRQPIVSAPAIKAMTDGRLAVIFGTGANFSEFDRARTGQAIYGIYDNGASTVGNPISGNLVRHDQPSAGNDYTRTSTKTIGSNNKGWYIPLTDYEQVIATPTFLGQRLTNSVAIDSVRFRQECTTTGEGSFRTIVNFATGSAEEKPYFDTNNDGKVNGSDQLYNRQPLSTGVNYGKPLLLTLPGKRQALCNTGAGGTLECTPIPSSSRIIKRVTWREIVSQ